jgi:hypothetical protein
MPATAREFAQIGCCDAKTGARRELFFAPMNAFGKGIGAVSRSPQAQRAGSRAHRCVANRAAVFKMFFRERFRARRARCRVDNGGARSPPATARRPRRERAGTFVLQKC